MKQKKFLLEEQEDFACRVWKPRYAGHHKVESDLFFPSVIGVDMNFYIAGDDNCNVYFWKDQGQIDQKCGGVLKGHSSMIYRLAVDNH